MLTYSKIQALIPKASRNTEDVDHAFADALIKAVMDELSAVVAKPTIEQLNSVLWPHDVRALPPEEMEKLLWLSARLRLLAPAQKDDEYVADLHNTLNQLADALGVEHGQAEKLIERAKLVGNAPDQLPA